MKTPKLLAAALLLSLAFSPARSETREQWIEWGAKVHGAFGAFIPVGIRIGLDARERLKADARGLSVTYYSGEKPPCPCVADGIMIATQSSPGQGTLQVVSEKAPQGMMAAIVIRNRKTGEGLSTASPTIGCRPSLAGTSSTPPGDLMRPWRPSISSNPNRCHRAPPIDY